MMMSAPISRWACITDSGVNLWRVPSSRLWNSTPSSVMWRKSLRLQTWNPPLSVSIGPFQPMNFCTPPASAISLVPGRRYRWYVFARMICASISRRSRAESPFTLASVPTGIKMGVSTTPCAVWSLPRRALLCSEVARSSNGFPFTPVNVEFYLLVDGFSRCTMNARAPVARMQRHDLGSRRKGVLDFFLPDGRKLP